MFVIDFNPVIVQIGFVEIRWYSMFYILGFILLYLWLRYLSKGGIIKGLDLKGIEDLLIYTMLGVVLGARLFFFFFYNPAALLANPLEFFAVWNGGMSFHGALFGVIIALIIFSKKKKIGIYSIFDSVTVVSIFALALGRIGNFINGELAGTPFNGPWCMVFPLYDTVCRHPYPIYAMLSHLLLFGILSYMIYQNRKRFRRFIGSKTLTITFLIGYGFLRIMTDFYKMDRTFIFFKTGQWLSIAMIIAGIWIFMQKNKNKIIRR